ncbi:metallochaperone AztD [Rhizobium halophilum]|uniref:metallochaperone AztD n=1 Tax=Rhizobium halophilum TaxID=2846852 RepID=UPI001EFC929B|nr:metallochaperone AztD [Rhizobium halophilum]MCF6368732.1 metallochaperone AztD [Rhizobium halophilum]
MRSCLSGFSLSTSLLLNGMPAFADDVKAWRLFVGDQSSAKLTVLDATKGERLAQFPLKGHVTHLVLSESGQTLFAVQMDHDAVEVVKTGLVFSDHGEHRDLELEEPVTITRIEGKRPVHAVPHGDRILQFFDLEGEARIFDEAMLLEGKAEQDVVKASAPHHGVAVPMGNHMLVSEPDLSGEVKAGELPPRLGLKVLDKDGRQVGETSTCTGLHGEASSAGIVAFGCKEGVLIVRDSRDGPQPEMLHYRDDMPQGQVGTLLGGKAMQFFLGNYGDDKVVVIDPSADSPYRVVSLPVRRVDFALDPERASTAYIFTEDGKLHVLDVLSGELTRSVQVTEAYSKDGHWRDPRPRLAVMGDEIAVTDPRRQRVLILDAASLKEVRSMEVEGLPFNIVAIGGEGVRH